MMNLMTPEEKAMTEKALQSGPDTGKIPLREDTFHLINAEKKDETVNEAIKATEALIHQTEKKAATDTSDQPTKPAEPVEPEIEHISEQSMLAMIDERLAKLHSVDFVTISFSKTGVAVALGVLLIIIWLLPVINYGLLKISGGNFSLAHLRSDYVLQLMPLPTPPMPRRELAVRIRTNVDSLTQVKALEAVLAQAGFEPIETMYDAGITTTGVMIATKDNNEAMRQKLLSALQDHYQVASEAANLTSDSDFAATLLVGAIATGGAAK